MGIAGETTLTDGEIARIVVDRRRIARRVSELAEEIVETRPGAELTVVGVLTGALVFLADLVRRIPCPLRVRTVTVQSYPGEAIRSRGATVGLDLPSDLADRHVLLVDDILDSGDTLKALRSGVRAQGPASLRACVLLRKDRPLLPDRTDAEFVGFDVPDEFLVGYGLDFDGLYRNLPDVCVLSRHTPAGETRP